MSVLIGPLQVLNGLINSVLRIIFFLIFTILYQLRFMVPYKFLKLCGVFVQIVPKTLDNYPKVTVLNERSRIIRCNCMGAQAQPFIRVALWRRWPSASPWSTGVAYCGWQRLANAQRLPIAANDSTGTSFGPTLYWFLALAVWLPTTAWLP